MMTDDSMELISEKLRPLHTSQPPHSKPLYKWQTRRRSGSIHVNPSIPNNTVRLQTRTHYSFWTLTLVLYIDWLLPAFFPPHHS